jgi:hypothetical protein
MNILTAYTTESNPEAAANQIRSQMSGVDPRAVIYFASSQYDPQAISQAMQNAFPQADTFGCSTAGEIVSGHMLKNSVVAMAINSVVIEDMNIQIVPQIQTENRVDDAFAGFADYFKTEPMTMDVDEYVGIILVDGLRGAEERLMDRIGELSELFFIGGSAGDDLKFSQTWIFANGQAYTDAALLALLKPRVGFSFIKTQSFKTCPAKLTATKVNAKERKVIEFNNQPASVAYAQAIGTSVDDVEDYFMSNPIGLVIEDDPYVRSPQRIEDQSMFFYCNVMEGMELNLLESTDIVSDTKAAVEEAAAEGNNIAGIINFHCILRTLGLEKAGQTEDYGAIFSKIPTIGFSTYGEAFLGHINQTATMLILNQ